jgi:hypothetical protein
MIIMTTQKFYYKILIDFLSSLFSRKYFLVNGEEVTSNEFII